MEKMDIYHNPDWDEYFEDIANEIEAIVNSDYDLPDWDEQE